MVIIRHLFNTFSAIPRLALVSLRVNMRCGLALVFPTVLLCSLAETLMSLLNSDVEASSAYIC